ncbi:MAG: baseplate J/gp47 family protein [Novosphingobium sp.]|nr:baseplate J/gp47 family protein [Novosphingobium sp.]
MSAVAIDLSRLPPPEVLETLDFEAVGAALLAKFQEFWPDYDAPLESDPAVKLIEMVAYLALLEDARINDAIRSVLLAFASGAMLDHLAGRFNLARRVLQEATDDTAELLESDDEFRIRIQLAPETLPYAGITAPGYRARALAVAPEVKDVAALRRGEGRVDVILLGRTYDGLVGPGTVALVAAAFDQEEAIQLTDVLTVRAASIVHYDVAVTLQVGSGPDAALLKAEAETAIRAYAAARHAIGRPVYRRGIEAAAKVGGVEQAIADMEDVLPGDAGAAWLETLTIETELAA